MINLEAWELKMIEIARERYVMFQIWFWKVEREIATTVLIDKKEGPYAKRKK